MTRPGKAHLHTTTLAYEQDMPMPGAMDGMNMEEGPPTEGDDNHRKVRTTSVFSCPAVLVFLLDASLSQYQGLVALIPLGIIL